MRFTNHLLKLHPTEGQPQPGVTYTTGCGKQLKFKVGRTLTSLICGKCADDLLADFEAKVAELDVLQTYMMTTDKMRDNALSVIRKMRAANAANITGVQPWQP